MAKEDVQLTFDLEPFKNSIEKVQGSLTKLMSSMQSTMDNVQKKLAEATAPVDKKSKKVKTFGQNLKVFFSNIGKGFSNTKKFIGGVVSKIPVIGNLFGEANKKVQKENKKTSENFFTSLAKWDIIKGIFLKGVDIIKKAFSQIPEIGMTFKAVGSIVTKNLLWPLRKELIPVLQSVLDWARNNRGMFLKWGGVVLNVFKAGKTLLMSVINLVKSLTDSLIKSLGGLTKFAGKDITQIVNILVFKLTGLFIILEAKLKPVFEWIGKSLGEVTTIFGDFFKELDDIGALDAFFKLLGDIGNLFVKVIIVQFELFKSALKIVTGLLTGFFKGMSEVEGLQEAWDSFLKIITSVLDKIKLIASLVGEKLTPYFEKFGEVIGNLVGGVLKFLLEALTGIGNVLEKLIGLALEKLSPEATLKTENKTTIQDGIIRPDGSIIKTSPEDTLVALKNPSRSLAGVGASNSNININMGAINIQVTEGNAAKAGQNFAIGLQQQLRQIILNDKARGGYR